MGILNSAGKAATQARDAGHVMLGGKNASGLKHQIVTATGTGTVEAKAPDGYIVTGGGWENAHLDKGDIVLESYPSADGTGWKVRIRRGSSTEHLEHTVYAVCVAADS
ncbi:hypothetical protein [Streptomyces sp. NPDC051183]|uniref:hypothetical protein n=1 Tax=Streptomyces sp. NPDC051183 TaxID=3155165 RepID=UPI00343B6377